MENLFPFLLQMHILFGFGGMISFWLPILLKKGSLPHRISGWIYVCCMSVVVFTSIFLSIRMCFQLTPSIGCTLGYLNIITFYNLWKGCHYGRKSNRFGDLIAGVTQRTLHFMPILIGILGIMLLIYGGLNADALLVIFGALGVILFGVMAYLPERRSTTYDRQMRHAEGMIWSGATAYTVFPGFSVVRDAFYECRELSVFEILPVLLPVVVGFAIITIFKTMKKRTNHRSL